MLVASIPYKFQYTWSQNASGSFVTDPIPATTSAPAASQSLGFPPETSEPIAAGGTPPNISDYNGIYKYVTEWIQWQQAGAPVGYDATFSTNISGYPQGAIIASATFGFQWLSQVDSNTSDPDTGGSNWLGRSLLPSAVYGQCQLQFTNSSTITLLPCNGNGIVVNGAVYTIAQAGITLSNSGLSASTLYYVYAHISGGVLVLTTSTTGHQIGTDGTEVKIGDATQALVGIIFTSSGSPGTFADNAAFRGVRSWFNRRSMACFGSNLGGSTASGTPVELSSAFRVVFVNWADDAINAIVNGIALNNTSGDSTGIALGLDSTSVVTGTAGQMYSATSGQGAGVTGTWMGNAAEGAHFLTALGFVVGGTGAYNSGAVSALIS